jgi:hypothetical protein
MRVCQFRHDGNLELAMQRRPQGRRVRKTYTSILQACLNLSTAASKAVRPKLKTREPAPPYPSFAVIEIFAFNTFDTGHPFSAASAYF